jgi:hypothetical protein
MAVHPATGMRNTSGSRSRPGTSSKEIFAMTKYQYATVDGHKIFYREAGSKTAPTILLLHGFPTSSHMFRNLIPGLSDRYHVVLLISRASVSPMLLRLFIVPNLPEADFRRAHSM